MGWRGVCDRDPHDQVEHDPEQVRRPVALAAAGAGPGHAAGNAAPCRAALGQRTLTRPPGRAGMIGSPRHATRMSPPSLPFAPATAAALADAVLALHLLLVAFVVSMLPLVAIGGRRGWRWVRGRRLRIAHVLLMLFITVQTWMGALCPLTIWEQALRRHAGEATYAGSFIGHWLGRLLYFDVAWWVFIAAYTAFAALVLLAWIRVPPRPR